LRLRALPPFIAITVPPPTMTIPAATFRRSD
jgi:hypothetical protein